MSQKIYSYASNMDLLYENNAYLKSRTASVNHLTGLVPVGVIQHSECAIKSTGATYVYRCSYIWMRCT